MNLVTDFLENSFEIKSKTINTIVIENQSLFTKFLSELIGAINKKNELFELIDDFKKKDITKSADIIFDLFNLESNNSNLLKKLYGELQLDLNSEEMYYKKLEMENSILKLMDDLIYRSRFNIRLGEINYQNLFKSLEVEFDYDEKSILEKLIEYMSISFELLNKELFIIVNLDSFLTEGELIELKNFLCYNEIRVLALQNKIIRNVKSYENLRIIDLDLCEI